MRIAGGVLLLIVGLWSLVGGGVAGKMTDAASALSKAAESAGAKVDAEAQKALAKASSAGSGLMISGIVILLAGILSIVAGIMFFVNKGKAFGFLAPGVGIIGEILFFALVAFNIAGVLKIVVYAFAMFAATKIGAEGQA